jgi:hypothetical protein
MSLLLGEEGKKKKTGLQVHVAKRKKYCRNKDGWDKSKTKCE